MVRKITKLEKKVFKYLNALRESGEINMFGAASFIIKNFSEVSNKEANELLTLWMSNYYE